MHDIAPRAAGKESPLANDLLPDDADPQDEPPEPSDLEPTPPEPIDWEPPGLPGRDDDSHWDVFVPDDDERDPLPDPGDFWIDTSQANREESSSDS